MVLLVRPALLCVHFFLSILTLSAHANTNDVAQVNTPDWVKVSISPTDYAIPKDEAKYGVYYTLVDNQVRVTKDLNVARYSRYQQKIINSTGVKESSQINLYYDPNYQSVELHSVSVIREGTVIDKLESAEISVFRQENQLNDLIYNGEKTVNLLLSDIRVGDTLDYSFSIKGSNPVFKDLFGMSFQLQWNVPVEQRNIRVVWERPEQLHYLVHNLPEKINTKEIQGGIIYSYNKQKNLAKTADSKVPGWFNSYAFIEFSNAKNWNDVAQWSTDVFEPNYEQSGEILTTISKIKSKSSTKEQQLTDALTFVQNNIRYVGIEFGENSHLPSPASETLLRRYGDCKDKAVLLKSILNGLNIPSVPALVHTDYKHMIKSRLPSPFVFNHVILKATVNNKTYWIDPTREFQLGNLSNIYQPDYKLGLLVEPKSEELTAFNIKQPVNKLIIKDEFNIPNKVSESVSFKNNSTYTGYSAERNRQVFANEGLKNTQQNYTNFYRDYYSGIKPLKRVSFSESPSGERHSKEQYEVNDFWNRDDNDGDYTAWFYANSISPTLVKNDNLDRTSPLQLDMPIQIEQVIRITFQSNEWDFENSFFEEDNDFFKFTKDVSFNKNSRELLLTFFYHGKQDFVSLNQLDSYYQAIERISEHTSYGIFQTIDFAASNDPSVELLDNQLAEVNQPTNNSVVNYALYILLSIFFMYILTIVLWMVDAKRRKYTAEMNYYPVSLTKFSMMFILTFGFYFIYWCYKNWHYIKSVQGKSVTPFIRAIFCGLFYYPLFSRLKDNEKEDSTVKLPPKFVGILLAISYIIITITYRLYDLFIIYIIANILIVYPLIRFINSLNSELAQKHNSKFSFRHIILSIASLPLIIIALGSESGFIPSEHVVTGDSIYQHDMNYFYRQKIIEPGETLHYFYSDAFLFIRDDGNGFTNSHVFSYWRDDKLHVEKAAFTDIKDIVVTPSKSTLENTIIKIIRNNNEEFLLFVSTEKGLDKVFTSKLKKLWANAKTVEQ